MPPNRSIEDMVCDKYVECRRKFHPNYTPGGREEVHWSKIADLVRRIEADPRLFIEAQFELGSVETKGQLPYPQMLYSDRAAGIYQQYMESKRNKSADLVNCQFTYLRNFVTRRHLSIDESVGNHLHPFKAFFRLLVCSDEALPLLAPIYMAKAQDELIRNTDLHHHLKSTHAIRTQRIIREEVPGGVGSAVSSLQPPTEVPHQQIHIGRRL